MREESEGYTKLTVELDAALARGGPPDAADALVPIVQSLIGAPPCTHTHAHTHIYTERGVCGFDRRTKS
jgi:hypothetical protein